MSADAKKHFKKFYSTLNEAINPDNITAKLYSARVLTEHERDEASNHMYTVHQRATKLLAAVERAISVNHENFTTFLDILETIDVYQPIALAVWGKWTGSMG